MIFTGMKNKHCILYQSIKGTYLYFLHRAKSRSIETIILIDRGEPEKFHSKRILKLILESLCPALVIDVNRNHLIAYCTTVYANCRNIVSMNIPSLAAECF